MRRSKKIGNEEATDFWHDKWYGNFSLSEKFKELYELCFEQYVLVATMAKKCWNFTFHGWLNGNQ